MPHAVIATVLRNHTTVKSLYGCTTQINYAASANSARDRFNR